MRLRFNTGAGLSDPIGWVRAWPEAVITDRYHCSRLAVGELPAKEHPGHGRLVIDGDGSTCPARDIRLICAGSAVRDAADWPGRAGFCVASVSRGECAGVPAEIRRARFSPLG